jgi:uncharacterized membrane protein
MDHTFLCSCVHVAGTSAFLVGQRKTKKELSFFLLSRGLWLIFLELTFVNFGWTFNIDFPFFVLGVIWALGVSMIALSCLHYLPYGVILGIGILLVAGHNLLDSFHVPGNSFKSLALRYFSGTMGSPTLLCTIWFVITRKYFRIEV